MSIGTDVQAAGNTAWRDFVADGVASSGENKAKKPEIRAFVAALGAGLDTITASLASIGEAVVAGDARLAATKAILDAGLAYPAGTIGVVYADSTAANNGYYLKSGASGAGSWTKITALTLPAEIIDRVTALEADLAAEVVDRTAAVLAEAEARAAADTAEATARAAAIAAEVVARDAAIAVETAARAALIALAANDGLSIVDAARTLLAHLHPDGSLDVPGAGLRLARGDTPGLTIRDDNRAWAGTLRPDQTILPGATIRPRDDIEGVVLTDAAGRILTLGPDVDPTPEAGDLRIYLADRIVGVHGLPVTIYPRQLLADRTVPVIASLTVDGKGVTLTGTDELRLTLLADADPAPLSAILTVRPTDRDPDRVATRALSLVCVPQPLPAPVTPRILVIGDSISNGGLRYVASALAAMGVVPQWIGTVRAVDLAGGDTGPLGEARSGWMASDYTYADTGRATPVPAGGEAAYLALSKADQVDRNPFVRAATGGDATQDISNGYVVDFAFYQSRFGAVTPDIVVWACGINDARQHSGPQVYDQMLSDDALIYRRLAAAWPAARIIRAIPGIGRAARMAREDGDTLWRERITAVIRACADAIAASGATIPVVPLWGLVSAEANYRFETGAGEHDASLNTTVTPNYDPVHPQGAANICLGATIASYIAAVSLGLI
ncbi:SGNH/GDSL hydrolase family protein [Segnochrobactraceae bacterium EtOH-i3]